jgi:indolepyruvate ferredoxin oxidoreductase
MAVQTGHLPVTIASIERAIELNGVAVEKNLLAFGWGRAQVDEPEAVAALLEPRPAVKGTGHDTGSALDGSALDHEMTDRIDRLSDDRPALGATLQRLTVDLIGFQNRSTAEHFLDVLESVDTAERGITAERGRAADGELLSAVAVHLHKLTAYKDEYEVARLMLSEDGLAAARSVANGGSITYRLHPPMLRALGMKQKLSISAKAAPALRALAAGKRLRGTALDPFGRADVRRLERDLITEYEDVLTEICASLNSDNLSLAIRIASLPDIVRGYEDLKVRRVGEYRAALSEAMAEWRTALGSSATP